MQIQVYFLIGFFFSLALLIAWLTIRSEKKGREAATLKMHGEIYEDAAKKNKVTGEVFSKPKLDKPSDIAGSFGSLPD